MKDGKKALRYILLGLTILTLVNLLLSASVVGLICGIVILVMVWGIHRGDYPLAGALSVFLYLYAAVNLVVLAVALLSGSSARVSALIWLGLYSAGLMVLGGLLQTEAIRDHLKTAKPPAEKKKRRHFFHGGWRDL